MVLVSIENNNPVHGLLVTRIQDTSCILAWLIEQGYEVLAFMADVGQEEASGSSEIHHHVLNSL